MNMKGFTEPEAAPKMLYEITTQATCGKTTTTQHEPKCCIYLKTSLNAVILRE